MMIDILRNYYRAMPKKFLDLPRFGWAGLSSVVFLWGVGLGKAARDMAVLGIDGSFGHRIVALSSTALLAASVCMSSIAVLPWPAKGPEGGEDE